MRQASIERKTKETQIQLSLDLDGTGKTDIHSGIGFLDHMLELFAFHSHIDLTLFCQGDLTVDDHHSVEDIAICLGQAIRQALQDRKGIARYGCMWLPMDETLCQVVLDISGRPYLEYQCTLQREKVGDLSCEMVLEFLRAFAYHAGITLHVRILYGQNDHHKIEAIFKALARALKQAIVIETDSIPSSKGVLE